MNVEKYVVGMYMANCYALWKGKHVLLIDPGSKSRKLMEKLEEEEAVVDAILLTHGHFDHIGGTDFFANKYHCPVYIDKEDEPMLTNPKLNCSLQNNETIIKTPVKYYKNGVQSIGEFTFEAINAPGHTNGCTLLKFDKHLFTGDVLFNMSIGRCDLPQGSSAKMHASLQMIKTFDPELIVLPGHGDTSLLHNEFKYNPYL